MLFSIIRYPEDKIENQNYSPIKKIFLRMTRGLYISTPKLISAKNIFYYSVSNDVFCNNFWHLMLILNKLYLYFIDQIKSYVYACLLFIMINTLSYIANYKKNILKMKTLDTIKVKISEAITFFHNSVKTSFFSVIKKHESKKDNNQNYLIKSNFIAPIYHKSRHTPSLLTKTNRKNTTNVYKITKRTFTTLAKTNQIIKTKTKLCSLICYNILFKRTMIAGRCMHAMRSAYYAAHLISNTNALNSDITENHNVFLQDQINYMSSNNNCAVQHKAALMKGTFNFKHSGHLAYNYLKELTSIGILTPDSNTLADQRILPEGVVIKTLWEHYPESFVQVIATLDTPPPPEYELYGSNQPNVDFLVKLYTTKTAPGQVLDKVLGIKLTYFDEKAGGGLLKHMTKGHIGLIAYDSTGQNVQCTPEPITTDHLVHYNNVRIRHIREVLKIDNSRGNKMLENSLNEAENIVKYMYGKSPQEILVLHQKVNDIFWYAFQCNPAFKRSLSFVLTQKVLDQPLTPQEVRFANAFHSKLQNRMYDLNKRGDFNEVYKAFIFAGKEIDPVFVEKMYYLHKKGCSLNTQLMLLLNSLSKNGF